jgi:hypothetical protein
MATLISCREGYLKMMAERERLSEMTILPIVVVRCFER